MANKPNMIYLPHPNYNFEDGKSRNGAITQLEPSNYLANKLGFISTNLKLEKLWKIFQNAQSSYWEDTKTKGETFCFIREDGAEFAIRIIQNAHLDVIGYWKDIPCTKDCSWEHEREELEKFIRWLENELDKA